MATNSFEGARRIAKLVAALWIVAVFNALSEGWIDDQGWPERLKEFGWGVLWVIGGLVFIWGFSWAVGWIVRGFMGVPRGQDRRH